MIAQRIVPGTVAEVAAALQRANSAGLAVAVQGGNTLHALGSVVAADVTIGTTSLDAFLAHETADLTCSVQAGLTLARFSQALGEAAQFVPIDAPLRQKATVGGTMAAGWLGPRRHLYGRARDFVIGSQIVLADGTIANAGGMVVKNVSGYDMNKLYVGSFGTLGFITQLEFQNAPGAGALAGLDCQTA